MLADVTQDSRELTTREKIGLNITARRHTCGLSRAQLGIAIGRNEEFIKRLELGRRDLTLWDAWAIARVLRIADGFKLLS